MKGINKVFIEVKNALGTSDENCLCGSWMQHWKNFSGKKVKICSVVGCKEKAEQGSHVELSDFGGGDQYIVPFCSRHNQIENRYFTVLKDVLVSADISKTCG